MWLLHWRDGSEWLTEEFMSLDDLFMWLDNAGYDWRHAHDYEIAKGE